MEDFMQTVFSAIFTDNEPTRVNDVVTVAQLLAREKYLDDQEKKEFDVATIKLHTQLFQNSDWPRYLAKISKIECNSNGYEYQSKPVPQNALTIYQSVYGYSTVNAFRLTQTYLDNEMLNIARNPTASSTTKLCNLHSRFLSDIHKCPSVKNLIDIDVDTQEAAKLKDICVNLFPIIQNNIAAIVATYSGFHFILWKTKSKSKSNCESQSSENTSNKGFEKFMMDYLNKPDKKYTASSRINTDVTQTWICLNREGLVPLPGTIQGGKFKVHTISPEEFLQKYNVSSVQ